MSTVDRPRAEPGEPRARGRLSWADTAWRLGTVGVVVAFLLVWELLPRLGLVAPIILPPVTEVVGALGAILSSESFPQHFGVTLFEMVAGFAIGVVLGLAVGVPLAVWRPVKRLTYPLVVAFQAVPKILFAPLLITWFGYGFESKIALAVLIAFFPVLINSMVGIESVPESATRLMRSLGATKRQTFTKLALPFAAPVIFAGVKTALTFAVTGAVVAEFLGATEGLGYLLDGYSFQLRIDRVYAVIVILSLLGTFLYWVVDWIDQKLVFWRDSTIH